MKKKILSFVLAVSMLVTCAPFVHAETEQTSQIKNIIFMIPDGGGYALLDFANDVKVAGGFDETKFPEKTPTNTDEMTLYSYHAGSMTTKSNSSAITDSGAAGTAMATGHKTNNGYIGASPSKTPLANLIEAAQSVGKAVGLATTAEWPHATPASFSAHALNRTNYYDMYQQIENKGLDVVLGWGYGKVSSWATIQNAIDRGYTIINDRHELAEVKPGDKIWGNMNSPSYDYRTYGEMARLYEMTQGAITALSGDEDGFFLMVEGSYVDDGGHANDAVWSTSEYLAFDAAWKVAVDFAKSRTDTIVIGAPDHDTGGMVYTGDMATEVSQVQSGINPNTIEWTSTNHTAQNVPVWIYAPEGVDVVEGLSSVLGDTEELRGDYMNQTGEYVIDNTALAPYCASLMGVDLDELTEELFVDVTSIGQYNVSTGKFTFNNGDKYVYANQSVYYKDGEEISMGYKEAIALGKKVFVPAEIIDEEDWNYVTEEEEGLSGAGTKTDPYLIEDEDDFLWFVGNMVIGETYAGKHFKQTADLDFSNGDYTGIGSNGSAGASAIFAGTYDGNGYTINVDYTTTGDHSPFPEVTGKIMNLGTTGSITSTGTTTTGGIALSLSGKMVNCYSTIDINGYSVGGLAGTNSGTINNCYFGGTITYKSKGYAITSNLDSGATQNCYYVDGCGATQTMGTTKVTETVAKSTLAETLDSGRADAATLLNVDESNILYWYQEENTLPVILPPIPTVFSVSVTPDTATVNKGDGLQFTATIEGRYDPSQAVYWYLEPRSMCEGTYIAEDGYVYIDPEETETSFTVMAKSKQNGSMVAISKVTVGDEVLTEPDGTRARPYLIENEADFAEFTAKVAGKNTYEDVYFKQTADLDMAGYDGYTGLDGTLIKFNGTYDGNGHTINVDIDSTKNHGLFSIVNGTIKNLGVTGSVSTITYAGSICRQLNASGRIINCWSTADVASKNVGGIAYKNLGTIANCYYNGTLSGTSTSDAIAQLAGSGANYKTFCVGDTYVESENTTQITTAQLTENLHTWLNAGREDAAEYTGCPLSSLLMWVQVENAGPVLSVETEEDTAVTAALSDVAYADGSVTGTITLTQCPEEYVAYVAIFNGTQMVAAEKQAVDSTSETFAITYTPADGTTYTVKLMLWDDDMAPCAAPATASVAK